MNDDILDRYFRSEVSLNGFLYLPHECRLDLDLRGTTKLQEGDSDTQVMLTFRSVVYLESYGTIPAVFNDENRCDSILRMNEEQVAQRVRKSGDFFEITGGLGGLASALVREVLGGVFGYSLDSSFFSAQWICISSEIEADYRQDF